MDKKETIYIDFDTLLIYTLWYVFSNNFVTKSLQTQTILILSMLYMLINDVDLAD